MTKEQIIQNLQKAFYEVFDTATLAPELQFFKQHDSKWSVADNIEHLRLSVKPLHLIFRLPKFSLLWFGKPNRAIRTYEELVNKYLAKLNAGGRAASSFVPHTNQKDKKLLMETFRRENQKLMKSLAKWNEEDLDRYLIPHPLLGKLYAREMLYFTIYHNQHHLKAIQKLL